MLRLAFVAWFRIWCARVLGVSERGLAFRRAVGIHQMQSDSLEEAASRKHQVCV